MKCKSCGFNNDGNNKFCINCGGELISESEPENLFCMNCDFENETDNKFCSNCGSELENDTINKAYQGDANFKKKKNRRNEIHNPHGQGKHKKNNTERKTLNMKPVWISVGIAAVVIIITVAYNIKNNKVQDQVETIVETKSSDPVVESQVYAIASKFVCSCQSCDQLPLESCKCGIAVEERQFIRSYLEKNQKPDDIVVTLANQYGWLKAEFAAQYKVDKSKVWNNDQIGLRKN